MRDVRSPMKIPSLEVLGGVSRSAGVGSFPSPQPTPGPDGPCPSREGNRSTSSNGAAQRHEKLPGIFQEVF